MIRNKYFLVIVIAAIGGIFLSVIYVNPYNSVTSLSEFVLQLSGSRGDLKLGFSMTELVALATRLLPNCVFEAYVGVMFYRHFCTASIYVFSRCTKRGKWYLKEMISLGCSVMAFQVILLLFAIITTVLRYRLVVDYGGILLLIYHFAIQFLWTYLFTILINLLAIRVGSNQSFAIAMIAQTFCIAILGLKEVLNSFLETDIARMNLFLKINPVSHLVLGWHSSNVKSIEKVINSPYEGLYLSESMLIYIVGVIFALIVGAIVVKRHDLLILDSEMGAM